jgi:hypothetical protein
MNLNAKYSKLFCTTGEDQVYIDQFYAVRINEHNIMLSLTYRAQNVAEYRILLFCQKTLTWNNDVSIAATIFFRT